VRPLTTTLVLIGILGATAGATDAARQLHISEAKALDVPLFPFYGIPVSDSEGDLFFHLGGDLYTNATIMRLDHSSWKPSLYKLPSEVQQAKYLFYHFTVTPSGEVWMLANAGPDLLVVSFESDGQESAATKLDLSLLDVDIMDFAALDNGSLLLAGVTVGKDAGRPFAALFDGGTGKSIRNLTNAYPRVDDKDEKAKLHAGNASVGDDGNIYLLHESEIIVISAGGEIVNRISFKRPGHDLIPTSVRVSSGYAAVWLRTPPREDHRFDVTYEVVDLSDGKTVGWYQPPAEIRMSAMGFSRSDGFRFLVAKDGHLNLVEANLR